jgi:hypothetical protein
LIKFLLFCLLATALHATEGIHFFENKVKPIFQEHCNKCHNKKKGKGGLRLDLPEGILHGGDSGKIIDLQHLKKSTLLIAIKRLDEDLEMPPKNALAAQDVATLEKWLKMGAPMPKSKNKVNFKSAYKWAQEVKHWAYITPQKAVEKNSIDQFVNDKLKRHNLNVNSRASKIELIRRASYDLRGLPPTPKETVAFLNDKTPHAFAKVIDHLLGSPQYGERWARHWLDVARYGDDQPYAFQQKKLTNAWKYRDWVVKAFNDDLPYTEFIRRQLAADLIPGLPPQEQAATGLIATGPMYFKRTEVLKALADELDDRVDVVSKAFLGLTVSCARCHDHKFDAIPTKDYYALAGVFKSTRINDRFVAPKEQINEYHRRLLQQGNIKNKLKELALKYSTTKVPLYAGPIPIFSTGFITTKSRDHRGFVDVNISGLKEIYLVSKYVKNYKFHFHSWMNPVISSGNKTFKLTDLKPTNIHTSNKFYGAKFDTGEDAIICNGEVMNHGFHCSGTTVLKFKIPAENWRRFKAEVGVFAKNGGAENSNKVSFHIFKEDPSQWLERSRQFKNIDEKLYLNTDTSKMSSVDASEYKKLQVKLSSEKPRLPPIVHGLWENEKRNLKINIRGNPKKLGKEAPRGYLRILNGGKTLDFKNGSGRLELANLIANKQNPLVARVMVNRVWHNLFGQGIVTSPSNFGKLGDPPSNQPLLDWLAVNFMENNWSVKKIIKTIMLSKAYQRSSRNNLKNANIDGANKYLWRQNMKRLDAESMRDSILMVSGKLTRTVGGASSNSRFGSTYTRRMLYAKVSRTAPDSMRAIFDFPSSANSAPKRNNTTVPQQKLFYLNSDFMMSMAKSLEKRLKAHHNDPDKQLNYAFKILYSRSPRQAEIDRLLPFMKGDDKSRQLLAQTLLISNEFSYID